LGLNFNDAGKKSLLSGSAANEIKDHRCPGNIHPLAIPIPVKGF
jgi:hypothetical protein